MSQCEAVFGAHRWVYPCISLAISKRCLLTDSCVCSHTHKYLVEVNDNRPQEQPVSRTQAGDNTP